MSSGYLYIYSSAVVSLAQTKIRPKPEGGEQKEESGSWEMPNNFYCMFIIGFFTQNVSKISLFHFDDYNKMLLIN